MVRGLWPDYTSNMPLDSKVVTTLLTRRLETWAHSGMCDTVLIGTIVIVLIVWGAKKTLQELLMLPLVFSDQMLQKS